MADRRSEIEILINAKNAASAKLAEVAASLQKLDKEFDGIKKTVGKLDEQINKNTENLGKMGRQGVSSADLAERAFDDLKTKIDEVERSTKGADKALRELQSERRWNQMGKNAAHAFTQVEKLAKQLASLEITPAQERDIALSLERIFNSKGMRNFDNDWLRNYAAATTAAVRNSNRQIFSERSKLEREITNLVAAAEKDRAAALDETVAKIVDIQKTLERLGDQNANARLRDNLTSALGRSDISQFDDLLKTLKAIGVVSQNEALEIQKTAALRRQALVEEGIEIATRIKDHQKLAKLRTETELKAAQLEREIGQLQSRRRKGDLAQLRELQSALLAQENTLTRIRRAEEEAVKNKAATNVIAELGRHVRATDGDLRGLAVSLRGFQIAVAIKYAQALATAVLGLGGELVAVSAAAVSAGAALGGSLAAGALQAVGPIALLGATIARITALGKILNLKQQIRETPNTGGGGQDDAAREADRLDRVANANDRLRNANESLADAQRALTDARDDARKKLEDLIDAEERARLAALGSQLAFDDAQRRARSALLDGDVSAAQDADMGVDRARLDLRQSNREAARAVAEAARAQSRGVEGSPEVVAAKRRLADAERQIASASRARANAARDAAAGVASQNAQEDRLQFLLKQLTPSERQLLRTLEQVSDAYRKAFRPVTDVIVEEIDGALQRTIPLFTDEKIMGAWMGLARSMGSSIDQISRAFTSPEFVSFIDDFLGEGARNLRPLTNAFIDISMVLLQIGDAAAPIWADLVSGIERFASHLRDVTGNSEKMDKFFGEAQTDLQVMVDLARSVGRLFAALFDPARDSGRNSLGRVTDSLNDWARALRNNREEVREFFKGSETVSIQVMRVIKALAVEWYNLFSPSGVTAFADVLVDIVIPAIGNVVKAMGFVTRIFHEFLSLPLVSEIAQVAFTMTLLTRGLLLVASAWAGVVNTLALFSIMLRRMPLGAVIILLGTLLTAITRLTQDGSGIQRVFMAITGAVAAMILAMKVGAVTAFATALKSGLAAALIGTAGAATKARGAIKALTVAITRSPIGAFIAIVSVVSGALLGFASSQEKVRVSAEEAKTAIESQIDALRRLRDMDLERRDRDLALRNAKLRQDEAQQARRDALRTARADGKITTEEERELRRTKLDLQQANLDLERARRNRARLPADQNRERGNAEKDVREGVKVAKDRVKTIDDEGMSVKKLKDQIKALKDTRELETKGSAAYKNLTEQITDREEKLARKKEKLSGANEELRRATRRAARAWIEHGGSMKSFGVTSSDVFQYVSSEGGKLLKELGAGDLPRVRAFMSRGAGPASGGGGNVGTGGGSKDFFDNRFNMGGLINGFGNRDTVPILAAPGEGILNRHQMPVVDAALRYSGMMQGGLQELWSRIQTPHYMAQGGEINLRGANSGLAKYARIGQRFGLSVTSGRDGRVGGKVTHHDTGSALDLSNGSGPTAEMLRFARYMAQNFGRYLEELIYTPLGFSIKNGRRVPAFAQADHMDHVHIADVDPGKAGGFATALRKMAVRGRGPMAKAARNLERRLREGVNKKLDGALEMGDLGMDGLADDMVPKDVRRLIRSVGLPPIFEKIAKAESNFNPRAMNPSGATGLFQIMWPLHKGLVKGLTSRRALFDPKLNARAAKKLYDQSGLAPWAASRAVWSKMAQGGAVGPLALMQLLWPKFAKRAGIKGSMPQTFIGGLPHRQDPSFLSSYASKRGVTLTPKVWSLLSNARSPVEERQEALTTLIHEWTHMFQRRGMDSNMVEGAAQAFTDDFGPGMFRELGIDFFPSGVTGYDEYEKQARSTGLNYNQFDENDPFINNVVDPQAARRKKKRRRRRASKASNLLGFITPEVASTFDEMSDAADAIAKGIKKKNPISNLIRSLADLTSDDGPLSRLSQQISDFTDRLTMRTLAGRFTMGKDGSVHDNFVDERGEARHAEGNLFSTRRAIMNTRERIPALERQARRVVARTGGTSIPFEDLDDRIEAQERRVAALKKRKAPKGQIAAAERRLRNLRNNRNARVGLQGITRAGRELDDLMVENTQDIFEAQLASDQASVSGIEDSGARQTSRNDSARRIAAARGQNTMVFDQVAKSILESQRRQLAGILPSIRNEGVRNEIHDKLAELDASIAEITAQMVQSQIEEINREASRASSYADLAQRGADLFGRARVGNSAQGFALRGRAMQQRSSAIEGQLHRLTPLYHSLDANSEQAKELHLQIQELHLQLQENNQAIRDNTDQMRASQFEESQARFGFRTGIIGSAVNAVQSLGRLANQTVNNPLLNSLLTQNSATLSNQAASLKSQLSSVFGIDLGSLTGESLVTKLVDLTNTDTSNMTESQQGLFRNLVNALMENQVAIINNTQQLEELNGTNAQEFNSTSWQWFRAAVFNGAGGLMPQYASMVPQMATGGIIQRDGLLYGHKGEKITPAQVVRSGRVGHGDVNVNIDNAGEVVDPLAVGKRIAFELGYMK